MSSFVTTLSEEERKATIIYLKNAVGDAALKFITNKGIDSSTIMSFDDAVQEGFTKALSSTYTGDETLLPGLSGLQNTLGENGREYDNLVKGLQTAIAKHVTIETAPVGMKVYKINDGLGAGLLSTITEFKKGFDERFVNNTPRMSQLLRKKVSSVGSGLNLFGRRNVDGEGLGAIQTLASSKTRRHSHTGELTQAHGNETGEQAKLLRNMGGANSNGSLLS